MSALLPPEILSDIFASICLDEGTTGASLSMTCRYFRTVSAPYRFQSMAITGEWRIKRVCEVIARFPPSLRRVRYLYIRGSNSGEHDPDSGGPLGQYLVLQLLNLVASTLDTLFLVDTGHSLGMHRFPHLRRLAIRSKVDRVPLLAKDVPKLEWLHIGLSQLPALTSLKTHLPRLQRLSICSSYVPRDLVSFLGKLTEHTDPCYQPRVKFTPVGVLLVGEPTLYHSTVEPHGFVNAMDLLRQSITLQRLYTDSSSAMDDWEVRNPPAPVKRLKKHWLTCCLGGEGCWKVS